MWQSKVGLNELRPLSVLFTSIGCAKALRDHRTKLFVYKPQETRTQMYLAMRRANTLC